MHNACGMIKAVRSFRVLRLNAIRFAPRELLLRRNLGYYQPKAGTMDTSHAEQRAKNNLEQHLSSVLEKRQAQSKLRSLKSSPPGSVDFSSNDFLSLATCPKFRQDYIAEINPQSLPVGSTGSRLLDGNSPYAESLERDIAAFHGAESGLLANSGFDANVSIFTCIPQPGDVIVYDELIHASVHDGMRQSRATSFLTFKHNCLNDLRAKLRACQASTPETNIFVAVESVYSMDGDLAPLQGIVDLSKELFPSHNCHLIVDEAHATGVYGPCGRGRVSELGLERDVLVRLHTFGKALACNGAIILCSDVIRSYLINYARPLIYTTFMSYPNLTAIKVAYDWLKAGKTEVLAENLFSLIDYLHEQLHELLQPLLPILPQSTLNINSTCPESPIFALITSDPRQLASYCQAAGFIVRAVVPPTVPEGTERVRVCLHSGNTKKEVNDFVGCIGGWLQTKTCDNSETRSSNKGNMAMLENRLRPKL